MTLNLFDRVTLAMATLFLGIIALRPLFAPDVAQAQSTVDHLYHLYIEPGVHTLLAPDRSQQVLGKVVIDTSTGNIWGFPTLQDLPYPVDPLKTQPPTSHPMYLGKFDLAGMHRNP